MSVERFEVVRGPFQTKFKLKFDSLDEMNDWYVKFMNAWGYGPSVESMDVDTLTVSASEFNSCD
jgi:hypothetical protein